MVVAMAAVRIMGDLRTGVIQAPSLWRWAIGLTTSRGGLLCRPHLLRLEARTLGCAQRPASLDPRPLRRARKILNGGLAFRLMVNDRLS